MTFDYFDPESAIRQAVEILESAGPEVAGSPSMSVEFRASDLQELCQDEEDWLILTNRLAPKPGIALQVGDLPCRYDRRGPRIKQALIEAIGASHKPFLDGTIHWLDVNDVMDRCGESYEDVREAIEREKADTSGSSLPWLASMSLTYKPGREPIRPPYPETPLVDLYQKRSDTLGSGATGSVAIHRVRRTTTWASADQDIALKIVPEHALLRLNTSLTTGRARLLREFKTGRRHRSDRLVKTYDIFRVAIHEGSRGGAVPAYGLVMDAVAGRNLADSYFRTESPALRRRYALQLAEAVADLHAIGVVHRDVKPENAIVRTTTDSVVLVDYGIAKTQEDQTLTAAGDRAFTNLYAAPGQMLDASQEHKEDDIYALGLSLFEIVTGQLPFAGIHPVRLFPEKERGPLPVGNLDADDPRLASLLQRMTDPDRARRPTVSAVVDALRA
jgi:serine/threonine protein kinase